MRVPRPPGLSRAACEAGTGASRGQEGAIGGGPETGWDQILWEGLESYSRPLGSLVPGRLNPEPGHTAEVPAGLPAWLGCAESQERFLSPHSPTFPGCSPPSPDSPPTSLTPPDSSLLPLLPHWAFHSAQPSLASHSGGDSSSPAPSWRDSPSPAPSLDPSPRPIFRGGALRDPQKLLPEPFRFPGPGHWLHFT